MNAEQLHSVCRELKEEIESYQLIQKLQQLESALQNTVNQPTQPQHQAEVQNFRAELGEALEEINSEARPVGKRAIIEELGGTELLDRGLQQRIDDSFSQMDLTPSVVQKNISEIRQELADFFGGLGELISGFEKFGIAADELKPYSAELGILVPRQNEATQLKRLVSDLRDLDQELQVFQ